MKNEKKQKEPDSRNSVPTKGDRSQTLGTGWGLTSSSINLFLKFLRFGGNLGARFLRLGLPIVQRISKKFGSRFQPNEKALKDEKFLYAHAAFLLNSMVCGAAVIRELDKKAKNISLPNGIAVFEIEKTNAAYGLKIFEEKIMLTPHTNSSNPDVKITFCDPMAVVEASQQKLDSQAAVGLGRIKISGSIPLADSLELLMNQIGVYLKI